LADAAPPANRFLAAARQGRNEWWRYALTLGGVLLASQVLGALPLATGMVVVTLDGNPATGIDLSTGALQGVPPAVGLALLLIPFVAGLLALVAGVAAFHRRPPLTLVAAGRPRWGRALRAGLLWLGLAALMAGVEAVVFPGRYALTPDLRRWLPFALAALIFIPLQTSAEELFFRSYLLQGLGLRLRSPLVLSVLSGLAFALPHFANPEVAASFALVMSFFFIFGFALALITLRTEGAEVALGVHAANNLFTALIANFKGSAIETPALFTASGFDPGYNLVASVLALLVLGLVFGVRPRRPRAEALLP
jgi:membrane protease YdiL (CAAX protease family)